MQLSDRKIAHAKPGQKPYRLADEKALYLYITPNGARSWRYNYRLHGKQRTHVYGLYPRRSRVEANTSFRT